MAVERAERGVSGYPTGIDRVTYNSRSGGSGGLEAILLYELQGLEGIQGQNPETGEIGGATSFISDYTTRIFGAPFQLIDSVDRRFTIVNPHVGNEYLRNFILNAPILHIKPGQPRYTGGADPTSLVESIKQAYLETTQGGMPRSEALLTELAEGSLFAKGSKLQKRMFGFQERYWQYMSYVNYMCRSVASFLSLTGSNDRYPTGTFMGSNFNSLVPFADADWQQYRMLTSSHAQSPSEQLDGMIGATYLGASAKSVIQGVKSAASAVGGAVSEVASAVGGALFGAGEASLNDVANIIGGKVSDAATEIVNNTKQNFETAANTAVSDVLVDKVSAVLFMVEPIAFSESLENVTQPSAIAQKIDAVRTGIGHELAFITGSKVDLGSGIIEGMADILGSTVDVASNFIGGIVDKAAGGGFASNLFHGAIQSIKGQKMIYPKIYEDSSSTMKYTFTVNLTSPYGDIYNYYMNIVVPLMHLICLVAPRMISSNSIASPFLVQAFIPGMCTCELGIINHMEIVKNPSAKHVSVDGFPLDIKVEFEIEELYNNLAISPSNDPASFLFNECLNDYMANIAGLQPSVQTYTAQRRNAFNSLENYLYTPDPENNPADVNRKAEWREDLIDTKLNEVENFINPFTS